MMINDLFIAVLPDLPAEPVLAISGKGRLVTRALGVSGLGTADEISRYYLFSAELAAIHVQVKPAAQVRNAHENSTGRLHVIVGLFKLAANHLARIGRIGVDDIRSRDLVLLRARL